MLKHIIILFLILTATAKTYAKEEIVIGLIPEENIFRQMDRYRPLGDYLGKKLGIKVRFTILSRYGDIIDRFRTKNLDGAFLGALTSVIAMDRLNLEPITRPVLMDGSSSVEGWIIVRKDSKIRNIKDMKNKTIAFVDRATLTGFLFAIAYLREHGIESPLNYFREYYFTGSHASSLLSVLDGKADIGVAKDTIVRERMANDPMIEEEIMVIARSIKLPNTTLCIRNDMNKKLKDEILRILLEMEKDSEGRNILNKMGATRFIRALNDDFRPVYTLLNKAGFNLKTYIYR